MIIETEGYHSTGSSNITVSQAPNVAPVVNYVISVPLRGPTTFSDRSTDGDGTIASRTWNFGDGTTSTVKNLQHTYPHPGMYTVTLTVTDDGGLTSSKNVTIRVNN